MGGSRLLQCGWCLLGVTMAVLTFKAVEAAVINKDTRDLERFFLGKMVSPVCFHNLALCKIGCNSCDKCYQEYVDCGMASYRTTTTTTNSATVNSGVDTSVEADSMLDGAEDGATQDPERNRVRIPIVSDPTSWKSILVNKVRHAITNKTKIDTTTEAPSEQRSDAPQPGASVQTPDTKGQSTMDYRKKHDGRSSDPRDGKHSHSNTTDFTKRRNHHHHDKATAGDSKGKPRPVNGTIPAGNSTTTNTTESSVEPTRLSLPHNNTTDSEESHDHLTHLGTTKTATTLSNDGDASRDETVTGDSNNFNVGTTAKAQKNNNQSPATPHPTQSHTTSRTDEPREPRPHHPHSHHPSRPRNTTEPNHHKHAHDNTTKADDHTKQHHHGDSSSSTGKPHHHHEDSTTSTGKPHHLNEDSTASTGKPDHFDEDSTASTESHWPPSSSPNPEHPSSSAWTPGVPPVPTPTADPLW